ncbi:gag-pol, partial [Mucuna pruriens]
MSHRHEVPQHPILFREVFDVWGIDFMRPFLVSNGYSYILLAVDYMSRWVEAVATKTNDAKVVVNFLKSNIFYRFGVPKALINDQGSHFCNKAMSSLLEKYGVVHRIAIAYHPQTNGQAEVFIREIKKILQKLTNPDRKDWSHHLEDPLWPHRTAYRTPLGMSPYWIFFGKACHLPVELEHRAYWVVKKCNMAYDQAVEEGKLQLQELEKLHLEAYEDSRIYKKEFQVGQKVLLFNSRLKLITGKLCSKWDGPFIITKVLPYGVVELQDELTRSTFQANGQQLKIFHEGPTTIVEKTLCRLRRTRNLIVNNSRSSDSVIDSDQFCIDNLVAISNNFTKPGQMENHDRMLKELATSDVVYQPWCIQYPQLEPAQTYELKSGLIHLLPKFHGLAGEDPHKHLKEFHVGIPEDYIKMKAFPFSLDGATKDWLYLQPALFNT